MLTTRSCLLLLFLLAVATPASVLAQTDQTGMIQGRVVDDQGNPLDGAVVSASQRDGSYPRSVVSDENGEFRIGFLPPGHYSLTVRSKGSPDHVHEGLRVGAGKNTRVELSLDGEAEFTERVTVVAERPLIDKSNSEYGLTLSGETTEALPYSRRATDLIWVAAGGRPNQLWGGSTQQANVYQLDGVNVNDPGFGGHFLLPNVDWIEEFQLRGIGTGAEYGNFQGGLVNIVTKSGSNTFEGAVRVNHETESLNSSNVNLLEAGRERDQRSEINASVGGPLIKDKLYYFISAQETRTDVRVVDTESSTPGNTAFLDQMQETTARTLLAKATWQSTKRDTFNFMLGLDDLDSENVGINSIDDPATAWTGRSPASYWNASWQRVFGGKSFLELKLTGWEGDDDVHPLNGDISGVTMLGGNQKAYRNASFNSLTSRESNTAVVNWDSFWKTGGLSHHLKIGGEYSRGSWLEQHMRSGGMTWRPFYGPGGEATFDPEDPSTWGFISSDWNGQIRLDADILNAAVYVQDYLTVTPNLSVNFGLRYGEWEGDLTPGFGVGPEFNALSANGLDPRVGLTWDITGESRWVMKSHWGRYHQNLFALFFDRAEGGNVFEDIEFWDWVGDAQNPLPDVNHRYTEQEREQLFTLWGAFPMAQQNGPVVDYDQPYMDQFMVGLERGIKQHWKVGLIYLRRDFEEIVSLVDRNLESNYTPFRDISVFQNQGGVPGDPILDQHGDPLVLPTLFISHDDILYVGSAPGLTQPEIDALTFEQDLVLTNVPEAHRDMNQIQLTLNRQGGDLWINGSLVYTDLTGDFFSVNGWFNPGGWGTGPFVQPNAAINFDGEMPNHSAWEAKLNLTYRLPLSFRLGTVLYYTSGNYFTPRYVIDNRSHVFTTSSGEQLDPDLLFGVDGQRIFLEQRGSREHENLSRVDIHLDRSFRSHKKLALRAGIDVFNVFNRDAVVSKNTLVNNQDPGDPTTLFGATRLRQTPRSVRLSTVLSW